MRTYTQGTFEVIESEDGRARFTLRTVPVEDVAPEVGQGYARRRAELVSAIEKRDKRAPQWRAAKLSGPAVRLPKSPDAPGFVADAFTIGDWVEWYAGETRVVGQVWSHAPRAGSFWITTDRSGVTGRVHVMNRSKVAGSGTGKAALYVYSVGGSTVRSMGPAGADVPMTGLSDSLGYLPETPESYANHTPRKGFQPFDPVSVHVGAIEHRADRVWFPMVIDGIRMDADARGNNEWVVSVPRAGGTVVSSSAPAARGMVTQLAVRMLRELGRVAKGVRYGGGSRKYTISEAESVARTCHECDDRPDRATGNERMFTYEEGRGRTMCATHLARALSYRMADGRLHEVTTRAVEAIGDAQTVMGMRDSLAARAMVAMINGETDAPAVAEAEAAERAAESSAETCVDGADYAADRAERAERAVLDTARMDVDGAWTAVAEAESAARDAEVCAGLIGAERATYADRARAAVNRAKDAAERARGVAEDRQLAADDERCGLASVDDARAAANDARDSVATAERWAHGCPVVGGFPAELAGWVEDARAAAAEAIRAAGRAREAAAGRGAELRSWGRVEWFTIAGACADDARDAAKRAAEAARLAAGARGRADRAAGEAESAADGGAGEGAPLKVPALPQGLDANASMEAGAPGGEGVESRKLDANASSKVGSPATDDDGGDGAPGAGSAAPRPDRGPAGGPVAGGATPDPDGSEVAPEVKHARRRAEEADLRAAEARHRAEQLGDSAAAHYGRFAGGQPILMGHRSAAGALRDRARGDAATRRAIEARTAADRAESAARKARAEAELAETVHGRSRPWERGDFQRGDVVEVRKIYTDTYVVVRANAKTLTLRNMNTIDDTKARYDQVLSRRRDGQTLTDPGADSTSEEGLPAPAEEPPADGGGDVPGWAPALDGERWDYAAVRRVLVRGGLAEGELGERDGWHVGPDMWDVMITRVQGSHYFRPRGESARRSWDDALDAYRAAVEAAGMTVVRRNAHCVVVRVPVPAELRVTARARRTADLSDFTTVVEFEGFGDIGGTVTLRSAGVGASWYEVRDHTGRTIPDAGRDRRAATASLAYSYGLPTPAEYIEEGPAPAAPTTAEEPPRPAVADETGPAPQRAEDELRALVHDADRPAVPEPSAAAVPPPAEPGPEADGGPAPAAGPRPGPTPGGAPAAAGAPRPAAGAPCRRAPVARGSAAGVRGYPRRSQRTTGGHATTPTTTSATTPGGGTGVRAPGGRGPPRPPGRAPVREGALPWNLTGMRQVRRVVHPREGPLPRLPTPCQSPMPRCRHDRPRPDHRGRAPPPRPSDPRRDDPLSPHPHRHRQRP